MEGWLGCGPATPRFLLWLGGLLAALPGLAQHPYLAQEPIERRKPWRAIRVRRQALGEGRVAYIHEHAVPGTERVRTGDHGGREVPVWRWRCDYAQLHDARGRRLLPQRFGWLGPFHEGRAAFAPVEAPAARFLGVLDRHGRILVPPQYDAVSAFRRGWAGVRIRQTTPSQRILTGLIDSTGRLVRPLQAERLDLPDSAGFVRAARPGTADARLYVLAPGGRPLPVGPFREAHPFAQGRAWVTDTLGRQGLIDTTGRYVVPCRYEQLYLRRPSTDFSAPGFTPSILPAQYPYVSPPDPAPRLVLCRRAGKYGAVDYRSGREVVPARYDTLQLAHEDLVTASLHGQAYLLNARGRELARGRYQGIRYDYPQGPLVQIHAAGAWFVVDTSGRQRSARIPGLGGRLTPHGWAISELAPGQYTIEEARIGDTTRARTLYQARVGRGSVAYLPTSRYNQRQQLLQPARRLRGTWGQRLRQRLARLLRRPGQRLGRWPATLLLRLRYPADKTAATLRYGYQRYRPGRLERWPQPPAGPLFKVVGDSATVWLNRDLRVVRRRFHQPR